MYIPTTFIIWLRGPNSLAIIIMTARSRHAFRLSLSDSHLPPFFLAYQAISVLGMWKTSRRPLSLIWPLVLSLLSIDNYAYTSPPYLILIVILPYIKGSDSLALRICITTISSSFYELELRSVWGNETLCRIWFPNSIRSLSFHFLPSLQSYVCASKPNKLQLT